MPSEKVLNSLLTIALWSLKEDAMTAWKESLEKMPSSSSLYALGDSMKRVEKELIRMDVER